MHMFLKINSVVMIRLILIIDVMNVKVLGMIAIKVHRWSREIDINCAYQSFRKFRNLGVFNSDNFTLF